MPLTLRYCDIAIVCWYWWRQSWIPPRGCTGGGGIAGQLVWDDDSSFEWNDQSEPPMSSLSAFKLMWINNIGMWSEFFDWNFTCVPSNPLIERIHEAPIKFAYQLTGIWLLCRRFHLYYFSIGRLFRPFLLLLLLLLYKATSWSKNQRGGTPSHRPPTPTLLLLPADSIKLKVLNVAARRDFARFKLSKLINFDGSTPPPPPLPSTLHLPPSTLRRLTYSNWHLFAFPGRLLSRK